MYKLSKIAILGDFNPATPTHHALNNSTRQVKNLFQEEIQFDWISSDIFNSHVVFEQEGYKGLWIAPGSPYKDEQKVIDAITYARTHHVPTLGNCAGFQYMAIEFAQNVCYLKSAGHEETAPGTEIPLISKLSCSLVEQEEELTLPHTGTLLFSILNKEQLLGKYYCNYGLNEKYIDTLSSFGLKVSAVSAGHQVRAFELDDHPFFVGTLFQPALTSSPEVPNPIIVAFIKKSLNLQ